MLIKEDARYSPQSHILASHQYLGCSVASEYTYHAFPGYDICFDMGISHLCTTGIGNVFITHCHDDHAGGIIKHLWRRNVRSAPTGKYYASEADAPLLNDVIDAVQVASRHRPKQQFVQAITDPIRIGNMEISTFRSYHRIPCQGYLATSKRKKLKSEYQGLPSTDIIALKAEGIDINDIISYPEIAFPGDTSIELLHKKPELLNTRVLILECTGINNDMDPDGCYAKGHIHLLHLEEFFAEHSFNGDILVLTHFSARYSQKEIQRAIYQSRLSQSILDKIVLV